MAGPLPLSIPRLVAPQPVGQALKVVAIGGGTGLPAVLQGLSAHLVPSIDGASASSRDALTGIVTITDDGGSSGRLRRELGMLPPGDIRNCLAALAPEDSPFRSLLQHRFINGDGLNGHTVGNLILAALTEMDGDFVAAIEKLSELLECRGRVLPASVERVSLHAEFDDGERAEGETAIVARGKRIARIALEKPVRPLPETLRALVNADAIVIGPGSLYTSVLPNLLVDGVAPTISGVGGVRIFVANLMTQPGETDGLCLEDHLEVVKQHVGFDLFDYVLVSRHPISSEVARRYAAIGARAVRRISTAQWLGQARVVARHLAWDAEDGKMRHAPDDLATAILELCRLGRPHAGSIYRVAGRSGGVAGVEP